MVSKIVLTCAFLIAPSIVAVAQTSIEFDFGVRGGIPAADGWAYLIIGRRSYEGAGMSVWKYSPAGPLDTGRLHQPTDLKL